MPTPEGSSLIGPLSHVVNLVNFRTVENSRSESWEAGDTKQSQRCRLGVKTSVGESLRKPERMTAIESTISHILANRSIRTTMGRTLAPKWFEVSASPRH
jgi:hypothetical protein